MNKLNYLLLLMLLVTASCVTKKSAFIEVDVNHKTLPVVYIYRLHSMSNIMLSPDVFIDGEKKFNIKNKSYEYISMSPGEHNFKLALTERFSGVQQIKVSVKPNEIIYLRINTALKFEMNKPYSRSFDIEKVEKKIAFREMQQTEFSAKQAVLEKSSGSEKQNLQLKIPDAVNNNEYSIKKSRNPFVK